MKIILTTFLGVLFTLCFAPYHYFILGFFSFTGLFLILDSLKTSRQVFWHGFFFAFAHHVTGLYWISYSMLVEADKFAWMIPFSASLIPAYLALYAGFACYLTYKLNFKPIPKIIFFTSLWVLAEYARGTLLTGFPWNLAGYTAISQIALAQFASIFGVYGLSAVVIFLFLSPYLAIKHLEKHKDLPPVYKYPLALYLLAPAMIFYCAISEWGEIRLFENSEKFENTSIRIVQPNIPQKEKFDPSRVTDQLFKYYRLSLADSKLEDFEPDLIIWPEAATPLNIDANKMFLEEVTNVIPYDSFLILGSVRFEGSEFNQQVYNAVEFIDSEGTVLGEHYDKHHLVPFGEYVPLRQYLPGVERIANGIGDFDRGDGPKTIELPNFESFAPTICYEIIFPGEVVDRTSEVKPKWILTITNDAWFGDTSGPYQHLDIARMRAIEEGLPVIRSANTGISAVIDSTGRVLNYISLNTEGIIDTKLPQTTAFETYYSFYGNRTILIFCLALTILLPLLRCISKALSKDQPRIS